MQLVESTIKDLFNSSIEAFPNTTKRQHSTNPIIVKEVQWIPFIGVKSLFTKALVYSGSSGKEYNTIIVFKNVHYDENATMKLAASDGKIYRLERLSEQDVLVRCNCQDFAWRFNYYDSLDKSLFGTKRRVYEAKTKRPPANSKEMPGMCKHIMKFAKTIQESGLLQL